MENDKNGTESVSSVTSSPETGATDDQQVVSAEPKKEETVEEATITESIKGCLF